MIHTLMALHKVKSACKSTPSPRGPLSRLFLDFRGAKMPQTGLKMGSFHPFVYPKWSRMNSWKNAFLTHS